MAFFKETYTAEDELDYEVSTGATVGITRTDAKKGIAARLNGAQDSDSGRPEIAKTNAVNQTVLGAVTFVGPKGAKVVKTGRFVLQSVNAYAAADFGKRVLSVAPGAQNVNVGKVSVAAAGDNTDLAQPGDLAIIGGGNDTEDGGIGHFYLVERI